MSDGDEEAYGPALPPGFQRTSGHSTTSENDSTPVKVVGPVLPAASAGVVGDSETEDSDSSSSDSETEQQHSKVIGPAKCKDFQMTSGEISEPTIGPVLPGELLQQKHDDGVDEEGFGPVPPPAGQQCQEVSAAEEFEERARKMKYKLIHGVSMLCVKYVVF